MLTKKNVVRILFLMFDFIIKMEKKSNRIKIRL